jgi:peptidoglycan/xylan/chitin deacetylase (PgdA/CDA1 family)
MPDFGAFVISLDLELHWGVRDRFRAVSSYRQKALAGRSIIPRILDLFDEYGISATWATVGFLFARSRLELEGSSPTIRPAYERAALDPYCEKVGESEDDDPLHYASGIIRDIRSHPRQEIACHTFSHYYCLEPGQDKQAFAADLKAAVNLAANQGIRLTSLVFPRDQVNPEYLDVLPPLGIITYRGGQPSWMYRPKEDRGQRAWVRRGARLLDAYNPAGGTHLQGWDEVLDDYGLWNIRAGAYLRPYAAALGGVDALRLRRVARAMKEAALSRRIFHLWLHPQDLGAFPKQNLAFLRTICGEYAYWKSRAGLRSMNMRETTVTPAPDEVLGWESRETPSRAD